MARSNPAGTSENAASEPAAPVVSELKFEAALAADAIPARLHQAMRYASLGGGKRVFVRCLPSPPAN
jgi:hypothetical protein